MEYIDAEKLLAEIKIIQQSLESRDVRLNQVKKIRTESLIEFCKCITDAIESLQQEQSKVDLEKEIDKFYGMYRDKNGVTHDIQDNEICLDWKESCNELFKIEFAKHFFELGQKVNNEKEK